MKKNKKNVLFDLNVILQGTFANKSRGGVFWVTYEILREFIDSYSDQFNFYGHSIADENGYKKMIKTFPIFKTIKYLDADSPYEKFCNRINYKTKLLKLKQKESSKLVKNLIFFKILFLRLLKRFSFLLSEKEKDLSFLDFYQTFMGTTGIQKGLQNNKNFKRFALIHDVLPITNPECFFAEKKKKKSMKSFYNKQKTITKDTIIFSNSNDTKINFLKIFPEYSDNRMVITYLAADEKKFFDNKNIDKKILKKYKIPTDKKYILSLCSLNKRKNLAFLVESYVDFLEKNPQIKDLNLVLAGAKGWLIDEMFDSIGKADKYKDKIILTGFVDEKDINTIYNGAFCFVCPSLLEGFGMPVLEAMQCGIPVLSSNVTSLPEVYGDAALSFSPIKKEELIKAIEDVYSDEKLRKDLIKKGLKRSKNFSWKKTTDIMIEEYLK